MPFKTWLFALKNLGQTMDAAELIYANMSDEAKQELLDEYKNSQWYEPDSLKELEEKKEPAKKETTKKESEKKEPAKKEQQVEDTSMIQLTNENPTESEKYLYKKAGYYPIEVQKEKGKVSLIQYTQIKKRLPEYPTSISVSYDDINYRKTITFDCKTKRFSITGYIDVEILESILFRSMELWER